MRPGFWVLVWLTVNTVYKIWSGLSLMGDWMVGGQTNETVGRSDDRVVGQTLGWIHGPGVPGPGPRYAGQQITLLQIHIVFDVVLTKLPFVPFLVIGLCGAIPVFPELLKHGLLVNWNDSLRTNSFCIG